MGKGEKKILLIDDDLDDRELFIEALSNVGTGLACYTAQDGLNAIEVISSRTGDLPHVIFLDINMPEMNGWEFLKWLKEDKLYSSIPVIMYSTSSHQKDRDMAHAMGAIYFFPKPERFDLLVSFLSFVADKLPLDLNEIIDYRVGAHIETKRLQDGY